MGAFWNIFGFDKLTSVKKEKKKNNRILFYILMMWSTNRAYNNKMIAHGMAKVREAFHSDKKSECPQIRTFLQKGT